MPESDEAQFVRLVTSIEPWLTQVVIIGGWAYRLYTFDPSALQSNYPPLMTVDVDIAMPAQLQSDHDVRQRLIANGFEGQQLGEETPPATHYRLSDAETGFYAEFLSPLTGGEYGRGGKRKVTRRIAGVVSQQVRHLEMLLHVPWTITLDQSKGFLFDYPKQIHIANPVSFMAQKILIQQKRNPGKAGKDILYIYDTLQLFGARLHNLKADWNQDIKPRLHRKSARKIEQGAACMFGEVTDAIREAAQMVRSRRLSPSVIRESCYRGLQIVFS
jgi:hypothetical protein